MLAFVLIEIAVWLDQAIGVFDDARCCELFRPCELARIVDSGSRRRALLFDRPARLFLIRLHGRQIPNDGVS
jgi:hypothetical protein